MKKNIFTRIYRKISFIILNMKDAKIDKQITGKSLVKYVPSRTREINGATGSEATRYCILDKIYGSYYFDENESFIDVGCGKGRILAYMRMREMKCRLTGIELMDDVAEYAREWAEDEGIKIITGDAMSLNYDEFTIINLSRPFEKAFFIPFIEHMESTLTHPIKLFYWVDQQSGYMLKDRPGWVMEHREKIWKINGLMTTACPQGFSIWTYTPQ